MRSDWIIDVLTDLRAFAERNDMPATVAVLEDAALVALAEIAAREADGKAAGAAGGRPARAETGYGASNVTQLFAHRGRA